jgi:hypothetical protein
MWLTCKETMLDFYAFVTRGFYKTCAISPRPTIPTLKIALDCLETSPEPWVVAIVISSFRQSRGNDFLGPIVLWMNRSR